MSILIASSSVSTPSMGSSSVLVWVSIALTGILVLLLVSGFALLRYSSQRAAQELFDVEAQTGMTLPPVMLPAVPAPSLGFTDRHSSSVVVKPYTSFFLAPYSEEDSSQGSGVATPQDIVSDPATLDEGSTVLSTTASFESVLLSPIIKSVSLDTLRSTVESTTGTFDTDSFLSPDDAAEGDDNGYARKEVALEKSVAFLMNFSGTTKLKPPVKDAVDTAVNVTSPSVSTVNSTCDVDDDHYACKEVAFLMNFSGTKDKLQVKHEDFVPHAQDISVSTAVADAASGSSSKMQVSLAPVANPTSGQDESVSVTPNLELQPSGTSVHLLDPLTFAVDPDSESDEYFCEYNQINPEVTVAVFLRDFSAERTVKVTESANQSQGFAAEYVQPTIVPNPTPLEGSASPPPPTVSRSRFVPARTALGSYRTPTRSSSLKSIVSKPNVAKVGRFGKLKADSPSKAKADGANIAKENLKDSGRSKLASARVPVMVKRPSRL